MNWIEEYWESLKRKRKEHHVEVIKKRATEIYQITEHCGKLWFTYNGSLFCPCDMMKGNALESLTEIRAEFIVRNTE